MIRHIPSGQIGEVVETFPNGWLRFKASNGARFTAKEIEFESADLPIDPLDAIYQSAYNFGGSNARK